MAQLIALLVQTFDEIFTIDQALVLDISKDQLLHQSRSIAALCSAKKLDIGLAKAIIDGLFGLKPTGVLENFIARGIL